MNNSTESNPVWIALSAIFLFAFGVFAVLLCIVYLQVKYFGRKISLIWKSYKLTSIGLGVVYLLGGYICTTWIISGFPKHGVAPNPYLIDHVLLWLSITLSLTFILMTVWFVGKGGYHYFLLVDNLRKKKWS
jgi:hypothetical protein